MKITKAASVELSGAPSAEQLEKINRLTKKPESQRWNFTHILNESLIHPISYENSL